MKKAIALSYITLAICYPKHMGAEVENIKTIQEFEQIKEEGYPMVVKFFAAWCPACNMISKDFHKVADYPRFSHIRFITVNADTAPELIKEKNIKEVPTFLFITDGKIKTRTIGIKNPKEFENFLVERLEQKLPAKRKVARKKSWKNSKQTFQDIVAWVWKTISSILFRTKSIFVF